ncbi:alpha/beta fold hydrolase [Amycolatopsis sp. YIM 10]|uniref:alpha/beta fold hydrolase n=1 Tax=Amycolatopsis sp. YIM 10 TaxID=2653857 RepID=UPI00128FEE2B|nr:alpha/beta fold hydrolase [Amycolatopsis sp. YIM 10]QFU88467.1 Tripeptidyl aminopeptidase precursor [Amycolatopsis sp. YIM 10]
MIKFLLSLALVASPVPADAPRHLDWQPCPDAGPVPIQCADLGVPLAEPGGRTITLKVARLPATGPKRGTVLVNFGGPQGGQIASLRSRPQIFDAIRRSMDVVTWDPRGYPGLSDPVLDCDWSKVRTPPFPADQAEFDRLAADNRARADRCRASDPELFDHMDSAGDARDADRIRQALGENRMNFIGTSYGGVIAQAYARQFPERVRTLYIDGTGNHSARDWPRELDATARDYERYLRRFFDWAGPGTEQRWQALMAKADAAPIPAGTARFDGTQLRALGFQKVTLGPEAWPTLVNAITAAEAGDASGFAGPGTDPYPGVPGGGVKECLDFPRARDHAEIARGVGRLNRVAPNVGASFPLAWHLPTTCAGWPAPATNPPAPLPAAVPPMLGAGTWLDFGSTARALATVPGSRAIHHDGPGHNLFAAMTNPCVIDHVSRYVTERVLPPQNTQCD